MSVGRERYQHVPYPLGTPEWASFKNYAREYYKDVILLAREVQSTDETAYRAMLNAVMSPLVFLWEKWQLMTSEAKLPYATPEYKLILEDNIKKAKEITERAWD